MSAITLYSITNVLTWAKTLEQTYRPSEVIGFRPVPVLTRTWSVEVDEAGNRRLVAHWTQAR
jgi:hypothetical protein